MKYLIPLVAVLLTTVVVGSSSAQIDLRFDPPDTTFEPGATTRISVMLDDAVYFRTIELTVTYDSTLIKSLGGGPGALFTDSGFQLWDAFEEDVPGRWHGFSAIMGATDSLSGPGELFGWDVEGLIEGISPVTTIEVKLFKPNAVLYPDVTLPSTTLRVRWAPTGVEDVPTSPLGLSISPNPFNPRTRVAFDLSDEGHVLLAVFDARGRRIATLHEGYAGTGPIGFDWDGRDDKGRAQPGGVYFFRLDSRNGDRGQTATTKGILLK